MTGRADIQYGMATYIDPETSIRIAFRSSYRGEANYDVGIHPDIPDIGRWMSFEWASSVSAGRTRVSG